MQRQQTPFLEKFAGKTTRMGKQGITALIENIEFNESNKIPNLNDNHQIKKRPSQYRDVNRGQFFEYKLKYEQEVNLDKIIPSEPSRLKIPTKNQQRQSDFRQSNNNPIKKIQYVPSFGTDNKNVNNNTHSRISRADMSYGSVKRLNNEREVAIKTSISQNNNRNQEPQLKNEPEYKRASQIRQFSNRNDNKEINSYGASMKLSGDVMNHFQFLNSIQNKINKKS